MKDFFEYRQELREQGGSRGEQMEHVIVSAVNGQPASVGDIPAEAGIAVAEFLRKNGASGS